jgi:hypothetical protein
MRSLCLSTVGCLCLMVFGVHTGGAQSAAAPTELSADLGSCSALITVTGTDSKPVYAAKISMRVQYGPFGVKKLDLEAFTGGDGRLKITHLPETLKREMTIHIRKDDMEEIVDFMPSLQCHATYNVQLH